MTKSPFRASVVVILCVAAALLIAASVLFGAYEDDHVPTSGRAGPGTHSLSAIGHAGVYDMLRRLGWRVTREVGNALSRVGRDGVLVLVEPDAKYLDSDYELRLSLAPRVLVVLPKWTGRQQAGRTAWIERVEPVPLGKTGVILALADKSAEVSRHSWPAEWEINELGVAPMGAGVVQLVHSPDMRTIVGGDRGTLIGELNRDGRTVWVLADPDVMSNHGIVMGENAALIAGLFSRLAGVGEGRVGAAPLVFDENIHGFQRNRGSVAKLLFRFPYSIVTGLLSVLAALLLFAGVGRFGAPARTEPGLDFGKAGLIVNSARMLERAGRLAPSYLRYVEIALRTAAAELHAPPGMSGTELVAWLDRVGRTRSVAISAAAVLRSARAAAGEKEPDIERLRECAWAIHRWKGDILNGS